MEEKIEELKLISVGYTIQMYAVVKKILNRRDESLRPFLSKYPEGDKPYMYDEEVAKGTLKADSVVFSIKDDSRVLEMIDSLFKDPYIAKHYTRKRLVEIFAEAFSKKMNEKKAIKMNNTDLEEVRAEIKKKVLTLITKTFAYQIIGCNYQGADIEIGQYKIITKDLKTAKDVRGTPILLAVPPLNFDYKNFIVIPINGNDNEIMQKKAYEIALDILAFIKLTEPNSPKLTLADAYLESHKWKGEQIWMVSYRNRGVMHWDAELKDIGLHEKFKLKEHLAGIETRPINRTISLALTRFSRTEEIPQNAFRLAELIGCLETLLIERNEPRVKDSNIAELLTQRITVLVPGLIEDRVADLLKKAYHLRSNYEHESDLEYQEDIIKTVRHFLLENVLFYYMQLAEKFNSKKELIDYLDEISKKAKSEGTS